MQTTIEEIARHVGVPQTAIHKWRIRGWVAYRWREAIAAEAQRRGIVLEPGSFDRFGLVQRPRRRRVTA